MIKVVLCLLFLLPNLLLAQKDKRKALYISTEQGLSFMYREAWSNTNHKTNDPKVGYAFNYAIGCSIDSKKKKSFSDISLGFRSYSNGLLSIIGVDSLSEISSITAIDRFNYLTAGYTYSHYVKMLKNYPTFFSVGIKLSYILNRKISLKYDNRKINTKNNQISNNLVIPTSPTFSVAYGVEFEKGILNVGKKQRLSLCITFDNFFIGLISSPSNQYLSTLLDYQFLF